MSFRELPDYELRRLDDDAVVAYGRAARDAGNLRAARAALGVLVFGLEGLIRARVALRIPAEAVDDVAHTVTVRALGAAFDGQSVGELRSWINTILLRTIADFYRDRERRVTETPLPDEHEREDDAWGAVGAIADETGAVEVQMVVDEVIAELAPSHAEVIDLYVFADLSAAEVCARIPGMTEANVHQIATRFRAALRDRLGDGP